MRLGSIAGKTFMNVEFPKCHIGVKSFDAELVDQERNSISSYETYLHHWFAIKYIENITRSRNLELRHHEDLIFQRNADACNGYILPHYWGIGVESRGTTSNIHENLAKIPNGYEEKWLFNIMAIDTHSAQDKKGCTQCRCDQINIPKNFYNVTRDMHNQPLTTDYKGGLFCSQDNTQCKLREGFQGPKRKLSLRYKIMRSNDSKIIHDCQAEYSILVNDGGDYPHVQKANFPMEKGGYLIYGIAHMHSGVGNATLYGQDGRTLYTSTPKYGKGKEVGNEKDYLVGMSVCYPQSGSIKINNGEILTLESRYTNKFY
ncbi:hypothetical protein CR513_41666, partial [Mucuna pruriens]